MCPPLLNASKSHFNFFAVTRTSIRLLLRGIRLELDGAKRPFGMSILPYVAG